MKHTGFDERRREVIRYIEDVARRDRSFLDFSVDDEAGDLLLFGEDQDTVFPPAGNGREPYADRQIGQGDGAVVKNGHARDAGGAERQPVQGLDAPDSKDLIFPYAILDSAKAQKKEFSHTLDCDSYGGICQV